MSVARPLLVKTVLVSKICSSLLGFPLMCVLWNAKNALISIIPRPFPTVNDAHSAVNDKMQRMVVNHANRFDLLREAFNVPLKTHEEVQEEIKKNILDMVQNFSGDINVRGSRQISWPRLLVM